MAARSTKPPASSRKAPARKPAAKAAAAKRRRAVAKPRVDLHALGARVVNVFGPFDSRVLIEMSAEKAAQLFPDGALGAAAPLIVANAVLRDIEALRRRSPELADSALAAVAIRLALETEHPFNSATSKSACARAMQEALRELRELAPPEETKDGIDQLAEKREKRIAGRRAKAADLPNP